MADAINTQAPLGIPQENLPNFRAHLVASIEHMIGILDALDACCDLEEDNEDSCAAHDDDPKHHITDGFLGDLVDAEDSDVDHSQNEDDGISSWRDNQRFGREPVGARKSYEAHAARKTKVAHNTYYNVCFKEKQRVNPGADRDAASDALAFIDKQGG